MYKRSRGVELGVTCNKSSWWSGSGALTTRPSYLQILLNTSPSTKRIVDNQNDKNISPHTSESLQTTSNEICNSKWLCRQRTESRVGTVVRAVAYDQCDPGSISWSAVIFGLSLLVLFWGFSPGTPVFPIHQKPKFDVICYDSVWFVVSSISKATMFG